MATTVLLILFGFMLALLLWRSHISKHQLLPPGPTPLPIIGNVLQVGRTPHIQFMKWAKKYGPIFRIKMGRMEAVVINDPKLVMELLSDDASTGRMIGNPVVYEFTEGANGVINAEGQEWKSQRKFTVRTLKNFGFSSTSLEGSILDELCPMIDYFDKNVGRAISAHRLFTAPILNSLWHFVSGERCEWELGSVPLLETGTTFFRYVNQVSSNGVMFAPVLRLLAPNYFGWNQYVNTIKKMTEYFDESINFHKDTFDPNNLRDFIDHYLLEISGTSNPQSSFYGCKGDSHLMAGIFDLFVGGSETTANLISWTLLYLSHHQEVQKKLQMEIDKQIGTRLPSLSDKPKLPYTEAICAEVMRRATVLPLGIPHRMLEDKMFHGYLLPKGAGVMVNLHGIHHDPVIWGDPYEFRPERFLADDGCTFIGNEALMPFSFGKRKCIGETFGKNNLFLFVAGIFQRFRILPESSTAQPNFDAQFGVLQIPKPFKIVINTR